MERITIFDTTLRDGEQSPGCSMNISEKLRLAQTLDALGVDVIEAGGTTWTVPDKLGYPVPAEYGALIANLRKKVRNIDKAVVSVHCHDDLGLAVANTLAGVDAGARQVECTINGIGERAGNAALEEIAMVMRVRSDRLQYQTGIETKLLYAASRQLAGMISFGPQPNKPVVGENAFAHAAGIHQHGMLSNPLCYEIMTPESVGAPGTKLVLGKHSGRHALQARYTELGYQLSPSELQETYTRFIDLADRKKNVYDQDLVSLLPIERRSSRPGAATAAAAHPF